MAWGIVSIPNGLSVYHFAPISLHEDPASMPDLSVTVNGLRLPNPFVIASGPPGTNANVIARAFDEGWGAVVSKTVCLDASRIVNVSPRYARLRAGGEKGEAGGRGGEIIGWQNIELISDRPFETWLDDFRRLKDRYPDRVLIASVMEEYNRDAWAEIVGRVQETGVDALELNFSCPHGLPERRMGSAMGQDPEILREVGAWAMAEAKVPAWAKMTPNVTDIAAPARASLAAGCHGISAINTILCVMSINLDTLLPEPTVEGYSTPGGYSGKAVRPIALRMAMEISRLIRDEFDGGRSLSAMGGVETGRDAAQFMLLGADTVQCCTGVMIHGYRLVHELKRELEAFMERHGFASVEEFRGHSLAYFTSHSDLVETQLAARRADRASARGGSGGGDRVRGDADWSAEVFVEQSRALLARS